MPSADLFTRTESVTQKRQEDHACGMVSPDGSCGLAVAPDATAECAVRWQQRKPDRSDARGGTVRPIFADLRRPACTSGAYLGTRHT